MLMDRCGRFSVEEQNECDGNVNSLYVLYEGLEIASLKEKLYQVACRLVL